jgi:hypothetical protein
VTIPVIPSFGQRPLHASALLGSAALPAVLVLLALGAAPVAALAQDAPAERSVVRHTYAGQVAEAAQRFGIPEHWIWAVIRVESNGNVRAISTAGAMGLMQIMPGTWAGLRVRHRLGSDPFDPRDNIMAGTAYLREMHDRYGNVTAMLAAYNAGPGRYDEHLLRGRPLPAETRAYLAKLAAISGSAGDTHLAAAPPPDPFAWRRAALFAVRPGAVSTAPSSASRPAPDAQPEPPTDDGVEPAMTDAPALSNDLFVPLSGRPPQ